MSQRRALYLAGAAGLLVVSFAVLLWITAPYRPHWVCRADWHPALYCAPGFRGPGG
jgi:hypothetical protein